jgi:trimeric autotransporter adhesin
VCWGCAMKVIRFCFAILAGVLLFPQHVRAQAEVSGNSTVATHETEVPSTPVRVTGAVRLLKGGLVPGATVRVVHTPSGHAWVGWTDEDGKFLFQGLPAGHYRVEAEHLGLGSAAREVDVTGNSKESMEITLGKTPMNGAPADPAPLPASKRDEPQTQKSEPATATRSGKHHLAQAAQANNADASTPQKTVHGFEQVEPTGQPTAMADSVPQTSNSPAGNPLGQTTSSDSFLLSGTVASSRNFQNADVGDQGDSLSGQDNPEDDSAQEKSAGKSKRKHSQQGHGHHAKAAATDPGNIDEGTDVLLANQRMKHLGANRVRFSLSNVYGNSIWNARPYSLAGESPTKLSNYNERFGASAGGPLLLPGIYDGRKRTFFYVNYQLDHQLDPLNTFLTVPLPAERRGDFSERGVQLFDPKSNLSGPRKPLGSVIPADRLDPAAQGLMNLIPLPNLPGTVQNYHRQGVVPQRIDRLNARVLHSLSAQLSLEASYNLVSLRAENSTPYPSFSGHQSVRDQNLTIGLTQNWTPRFLNQTQTNFNRSRIQSLNGFAYKQDLAGHLGITGISGAPIDWGAPAINLTNFDGISDAIPAIDRNQTVRLVDNISYTLHKHTMRAGGEIRRREINTFSDPTPRGDFTFTGLMTSQLDSSGHTIHGTGFDLADFLLGLPETTNVRFGSSRNYGRDWWFASYFEDDWRVHPRFSVNLGVRYELVTPLSEKYNRLANLDLNPTITAVALVLPGQPAQFSGSLPASLIRIDTRDWAPRVGFAWRPLNRGPVIRGGYGMFYTGSVYNQVFTSMIDQAPFAQSQTSLTSDTRVLTLENGFPPQAPDLNPNTIAVNPDYQVGYAQIWNLSVETPISPSLTIETTYTGTKGTHLDLLLAPNQALPGNPIGADSRRRIPNAADFTYETSGADSIFHGVQVRVQRRMAHGMRFLTLYTFSKSIDDASAIGVGNKNNLVQNFTNIAAERGLSSFDVRHQLRNWFSYELPFGERGRWLRNGWTSALCSNWKVSSVTVFSSGARFTPLLSGADVNGTGAIFSQRPDKVANPNLPSDQRKAFQFFNSNAFAFPPVDRFGDAARGSIIGPGVMTVDFALQRRMHFGSDGRVRADFRWEVQNALNHPNYSGLSTVIDGDAFGRVRGTQPMRTMDIAIKVHF